jgi:hypothetical protein
VTTGKQLTGVAVGVSEPQQFVFRGKSYRFAPLPQAADDVIAMRGRLHTLAQAAGLPLVIESLVGARATRAAILGTIQQELESLAPNGLFLFILEGHGTEVPDVDGDEVQLGYAFDQAFPTADEPVIDDDLWALWAARPDISIFTIADTCRAETISVRVTADQDLYRHLGVVLSSASAIPRRGIPLVRQLVTTTGPSILQFAASTRATDAGDIILGDERSGRFTQAVLTSSKDLATLHSYRAWFTAVDREVRDASDQIPVLYYMGPSPNMIDDRPAFAPLGL